MLYGSRWISAYAVIVLVAFQWLWGVSSQVFPDLPLLEYGRWIFPVVFGYLTPVWLKAGERALRGRSALGEGCFSTSWRNLACAALTRFADYVPSMVLAPGDPRLWPLVGLVWSAGWLLLPFLVLGGQSPMQGGRSVRRAVKQRPLLVLVTLLVAAGVSTGLEHALAKIWEHLAMLLIQARQGELGGLFGVVLRWPVTSVGAYLCQMLLTAVGWLVPGMAALWIYWKSTKQEA